MKRIVLLLLLSATVSLNAIVAQERKNPHYTPGFETGGYALSVNAGYGYNKTWLNYGIMEVNAFMPVNEHVELEAKAQLLTANVYTVGAVARPKIGLPVGELFIETEILYKAVHRARQHDVCGAVSLGYRMNFVSVQFGLFGRVMEMYNREPHSSEVANVEPFNLLYRVEVFGRPQTAPWNISAYVSNKDEYQMERMWAPVFGLKGRYDVNEHWRVGLEAQLKPTGIFHQNTEFYGAIVRAGFSYKF